MTFRPLSSSLARSNMLRRQIRRSPDAPSGSARRRRNSPDKVETLASNIGRCPLAGVFCSRPTVFKSLWPKTAASSALLPTRIGMCICFPSAKICAGCLGTTQPSTIASKCRPGSFFQAFKIPFAGTCRSARKVSGPLGTPKSLASRSPEASPVVSTKLYLIGARISSLVCLDILHFQGWRPGTVLGRLETPSASRYRQLPPIDP